MNAVLWSSAAPSGGAAPGYTAVVLPTPAQDVVPASWVFAMGPFWTFGTTKPETDEMARKAARLWKSIACLRIEKMGMCGLDGWRSSV